MVIRVQRPDELKILIDRERRTVCLGEHKLTFHGKIDFKLLEIIICGGELTSKEIFQKLFADDVDGGPLDDHISPRVARLRAMMAHTPWTLMLRGFKRGYVLARRPKKLADLSDRKPVCTTYRLDYPECADRGGKICGCADHAAQHANAGVAETPYHYTDEWL